VKRQVRIILRIIGLFLIMAGICGAVIRGNSGAETEEVPHPERKE
jgi:hypothetical protein